MSSSKDRNFRTSKDSSLNNIVSPSLSNDRALRYILAELALALDYVHKM